MSLLNRISAAMVLFLAAALVLASCTDDSSKETVQIDADGIQQFFTFRDGALTEVYDPQSGEKGNIAQYEATMVDFSDQMADLVIFQDSVSRIEYRFEPDSDEAGTVLVNGGIIDLEGNILNFETQGRYVVKR